MLNFKKPSVGQKLMVRPVTWFATCFLASTIFGCSQSDHERGYADAWSDLDNAQTYEEEMAIGYNSGSGNPHETKEYNAGYYRGVTAIPGESGFPGKIADLNASRSEVRRRGREGFGAVR